MVDPDARAAIREAGSRDAQAVADLWTEAYVTLGVGGRSKPYRPADFFESARNGKVLVVDRAVGEGPGAGSGRVAGAVVLIAPGAPGRAVAEGEEAELSRLAVASWARRKRIGRELTLVCEERARAAGWSAIALWSRAGQVEAHRLYESLGYRRVPERDTVDDTGLGRLAFRLAL